MINGVLTINNTNESLSSNISNSFIPTSDLIYQWYEKTITKANLTNNLLFSPIGTNNSTLSLSNINATYTTSYKLIVSFTYNSKVYEIVSNVVQVYYENSIGTISIANANNQINITISNGSSVILSINTSKLLTSNVSYQWQEEKDGI